MKIPALFAAAALAATALIASTPASATTHATPSKMDSKTHSLHALAGKKKKPALKQLTKGPLYSSNARKGVRFEASNLKPKARVRLCTVIVTNDVSSYCTKPVRVSASGKAMYKISLSTPGPHEMHIEIMGFDELGYEETIDSFYFARSVPILDDFKGAKLTVSPKALRAKSLRGARHKPIARLNKSNYDAGD
ncbi:hypothetical protein GSY69_11565 [Brevibacterium sp. 5221]|uniref:Uncharacterized protein n=1 Tax=Brevibacterium rongguiense TaxID=2695267 RepID=A0A6N9H912_9MICO|nr:hypothetical protein [Brevibacterium rongguiense]MYM20580.1 hypothetical protein [Brevibacterium rongguiense]